jgi:hypothetical protein
MSLVDIEKLQSVGKDMQAARKEFIMRDDQEKAWDHLTTVIDGRVDFVLDNGTEFLIIDVIPCHTLTDETYRSWLRGTVILEHIIPISELNLVVY